MNESEPDPDVGVAVEIGATEGYLVLTIRKPERSAIDERYGAMRFSTWKRWLRDEDGVSPDTVAGYLIESARATESDIDVTPDELRDASVTTRRGTLDPSPAYGTDYEASVAARLAERLDVVEDH
jgi:hypothetical protein